MQRQVDLTKSRIPELDGIRGLAILLVVLFHYITGSTNDVTSRLIILIKHSIGLSWTGVDLFFVLSGFLIGGILIDHRNSKEYFKTFYIRRICRILPIYFLWILLFFIAAKLFSASSSSEWYSLNFRQLPHLPRWGYFVFFQNFYMARLNDLGPIWTGVTWSLCIEEQFYLLMPFVIWFVPVRKLPAVLVLLILLVPLFRLFLYLYHSSVFMYVLLPCRAEGLLLGVLCACLTRNANFQGFIRAKQGWLYAIFCFLFCGMLYLTVLSAKFGAFAVYNFFEMIFYGYSCISYFYACFLLIIVTAGTSWLARIMRNPFLRHLGVVSYSIYLIHGAVAAFLFHLILGKNSLVAFNFYGGMVTLLAFFVTWGLAILSWRFIEAPIIAWGHSFLYDKGKLSDESEAPINTQASSSPAVKGSDPSATT